jgi:plastocyanin domain-containing protein
MLNKTTIISIAIWGFLLGTVGEAPAQKPHETHQPQTTQFQPIEQPLVNKVAVTATGLGLIGLELWWFLLSKPKS